MANNSEQIEAKLCAYLEGEIDAKDRAEIERHLEKNPGHRKLLNELARTRTLLGGLPRVKAPIDVAEQLQGQLERSVLLDGMDESETGALRIGPRWPQYLAYAAVAMLAVGLVSVVYFVVQPEGAQSGGPVAVNLPAAETDSVARMSELPSEPADPGATDLAPLAAAPSETAVATAQPMPSVPGTMTPSLIDELQPSAIFDAHPPGRETMFVVVEADDPSYANKQVASYMLSNNISWQNIAQPMSDAEAETTTGSRMQYQRVGPTLSAGDAAADADARAEASRPRDNASGAGPGFVAPSATAAAAAPTTRGYGGVPPSEVAMAGPPPAAMPDTSREARAKEEEAAKPKNEAIAENAIVVARNIPRSQALEMRDSLHLQSGQGSRIYSQFIPADTLEKQFAFKDGSVYFSPTEPVGRIAQIYPEVFDSLMKSDPAAPEETDKADDEIPLVMQQAIDSFVLRNSTEPPIPWLLESSQRVTDGARMVSLDQFSAPTSPPEDRMDVVIVVQPKSTAEPATRPVTPARTP